MPEKSKTSAGAKEFEQSVKTAIAEMQKAGLGSLAWLGTDWMQNMTDLGGEMRRFMADRIKEDVKTQHEILHAKDMTEVQTIQAQFLKDAFDQYAAETGKLVEMSHEFIAKAQARVSGKS